jgi:tRNA uridine 5-carboxymethylaminomethyl modification enzyme
VTEPYRMLTARAEHRLHLRADNADARLTPKAMEIGCVSAKRRELHLMRSALRKQIDDHLARTASANQLHYAGANVSDNPARQPLSAWLRHPEVGAPALVRIAPALANYPPDVLEEAVQDYRYAPYVQRQRQEAARTLGDENVFLAADLEYADVPGLSNEMIERLSAARPSTLGEASRVRGITPAALAAILVHVRKKAA